MCLFVVVSQSVCVLAITWHKIDQAGGPKTFVWPKVHALLE